jgi:mannose-6-phosphate isomerase
VDVEELLRILNFTQSNSHILIPQASILGEEIFPLEVEEFSLSRVIASESIKYLSPENRSAEILLCIQGSAYIHFDGGNSRFCLEKGGSVLIPAAMNSYGISGDAAIYKAGTPL